MKMIHNNLSLVNFISCFIVLRKVSLKSREKKKSKKFNCELADEVVSWKNKLTNVTKIEIYNL